MEAKFEKKIMDTLFPFKFKINYWLLRKLGLWGFGIFAFLYGVLITILVYEFLILMLKN